jgi:hypothetical protein
VLLKNGWRLCPTDEQRFNPLRIEEGRAGNPGLWISARNQISRVHSHNILCHPRESVPQGGAITVSCLKSIQLFLFLVDFLTMTSANNKNNSNISNSSISSMARQQQPEQQQDHPARMEETSNVNDDQHLLKDDMTNTSMTSDCSSPSLTERRLLKQRQQQLLQSLTKFHQDRRKTWKRFLKNSPSTETTEVPGPTTTSNKRKSQPDLMGLPTDLRAALAHRETKRHVLMDLVAATFGESSSSNDDYGEEYSAGTNTRSLRSSNDSKSRGPCKNPLRRSLSSRRRALQASALRDFKGNQSKNLDLLRQVAQQAQRFSEARRAIDVISQLRAPPPIAQKVALVGQVRRERIRVRQERAQLAAQQGQDRQEQMTWRRNQAQTAARQGQERQQVMELRRQRATDAAQQGQYRQEQVTWRRNQAQNAARHGQARQQVMEIRRQRANEAAQQGQYRQAQVIWRRNQALNAARQGQARQQEIEVRRQRANDAARAGQERLALVKHRKRGAQQTAQLALEQWQHAHWKRQRAQDVARAAAAQKAQQHATVYLQARVRGYLIRKHSTVIRDMDQLRHEFVWELAEFPIKFQCFIKSSSLSFVNDQKIILSRRVSDLTTALNEDDSHDWSLGVSTIGTDSEVILKSNVMDEDNGDDEDTFHSIEPPQRFVRGGRDSLRSQSGSDNVVGNLHEIPTTNDVTPYMSDRVDSNPASSCNVAVATTTMVDEGNNFYTSYFSEIKDGPSSRTVFKPRGDFIQERHRVLGSSSSGSSDHFGSSISSSSVSCDSEASAPRQKQPRVARCTLEDCGTSGHSTSCSFLSSRHTQTSSADVSIESDDSSLIVWDTDEEDADLQAAQIPPPPAFRSASDLVMLSTTPPTFDTRATSLPPLALRRVTEPLPGLPVRNRFRATMEQQRLSVPPSPPLFARKDPLSCSSPQPPQRKRSQDKRKELGEETTAVPSPAALQQVRQSRSPCKPVRQRTVGASASLPDVPFVEESASSEVLKAKEQDTWIRGSIRFPLEQQHSALSPKMPTRKRNSESSTAQNDLPDAPFVDELYSSSSEDSMEGQPVDEQVHQEPTQGLMDAANVGKPLVTRDTLFVPSSPLSPKMPVRQRTGGNSRSDPVEATIGEYSTMTDVCDKPLNGSLDRFNLSASQLVEGSNIEPASPVLPKMPVRQRTVGVSEHPAATEPATTMARSEQLSLSSLPPKPEVSSGSSSRFDLIWDTSMPIERPSPLSPQVPVRRQSVEVAERMSNATPGVQLLGSPTFSRMTVHEEDDPNEEVYGSSARLHLRDNIDPSSSALPAVPVRYDSLEAPDSSADSSLKHPSVASLKATQDDDVSGRPFANLEASTNVGALSTDGWSHIRHSFSQERKLGTQPRAPPFGQPTLSVNGANGSTSPMVRHSSHSTGFGYSAGQHKSPLGTASRHSTGGALPLPSTSRKAGVSHRHHGRDQQPFTESPTPGIDDGDARFFTSPTSVRDMVWARAEEAKQRRFDGLLEGSKQ